MPLFREHALLVFSQLSARLDKVLEHAEFAVDALFFLLLEPLLLSLVELII